ncbi:DUF2931 family protein [Flavobacterium branchiophilum]|nr:DUF2931 family protein [Flavobacterium branchiophilum]
MYVKQIIIITLAMLTIACKENKENKMENQISYTVTVNAPKGYPVEVHIGYLLDGNKKLICGIPRQERRKEVGSMMVPQQEWAVVASHTT